MSKALELIGKRFGRLLVISRAENYQNPSGGTASMWNCTCDCGKQCVCRGSHLTGGKIVSCGCHGIQAVRNSLIKHNGTRTRLYGVWLNMRSRCYNKNVRSYANYGKRGVTVCDKWKNDFAAFRDWALSTGYDDTAAYQQCTIERKDVNGNYEPSNCCWATAKEQANNRRPAALGERSKLVLFRGNILTLTQLASAEGISYKAAQARVKRGMAKYGYIPLTPSELERMKADWK